MNALHLIKEILLHIQEFSFLTWRTAIGFLRRPRYGQEFIYQMDEIGIGSLFIVLLTGLFTGMVLALQTSLQLEPFGATNYVGRIVTLSMVKELGPVLAALMVAGRVGSGIASELGSMVVSEQIDAMQAEGTDPVKKLVAPRVAACVLMLPLLTIAADTVGILGGYVIAVSQLKIWPTMYWSNVWTVLEYPDLISGTVKPMVFGFIVGMVGCYMGLSTTGGTVGVGLATTRTVVAASILILISNFFLTKLFYAVLE